MKFTDHKAVVESLEKIKEADHDMRERARENAAFVRHTAGQWESSWWEAAKDKPRYVFDLVNPIIDQIHGDIGKLDFDIRVSPAGGEATQDDAQLYDGIIRNIENISGARDIYNRATRRMLTSGFAAWRVAQEYVDDNTFDQDLLLKPIHNAIDRVWLGPHEEADGSDARYGFVLTGVDKTTYDEKYPDRAGKGLSQDRSQSTYYNRHDLIMVGELLYLKPEERELVLCNNGDVYEAEKWEQVADEMAAMGVQEERRRKRNVDVCFSRLFDAEGWITEPRETVFQNWIPLIPLYADFDIDEDKVTYRSPVDMLMDPQRVFNYSLSREIEEGALAPRAKYWMTSEQAAGHEEELAEMNTSASPIQLYNADPEAPGAPQQSGGAQINPGLRNISEAMRGIIGQSAGMFAANMGDNPGLQSGKAIDALQEKGENGNNKYTEARETAQRHTARILVNAIPRVYEHGRQVRLLKEDGSSEMKVLGQPVLDQQTGEVVYLHDLTQGTYDVTCSSGPSFKNRQNETVSVLSELAVADPTIIQQAGDILTGNITAPGMDTVAKRRRLQMFQQGMIHPDEYTDEEKQMAEAQAQQPPQPDPNMVLAQAEFEKAAADHKDAQNKTMEIQAKHAIDQEEVRIKGYDAETKRLQAKANAIKAMADAEAQDLETDMVKSGLKGVLDGINGHPSSAE